LHPLIKRRSVCLCARKTAKKPSVKEKGDVPPFEHISDVTPFFKLSSATTKKLQLSAHSANQNLSHTSAGVPVRPNHPSRTNKEPLNLHQQSTEPRQSSAASNLGLPRALVFNLANVEPSQVPVHGVWLVNKGRKRASCSLNAV